MKNTYVRILFLGIVVILVSVSLLTYRNINNYMTEVESIRKVNLILRAVDAVIFSIRDSETGHRGYQLTRDTAYLDPYYESLRILPTQLHVLDSLVGDQPEQAKRVDSLKWLIENQFAIISQILTNARRSSLYMDRYESSLLARGKDNMDIIRRISGDIISHEESRFAVMIVQETAFRNITPISLLIYTLVALAAVFFLFTRVQDGLNKTYAAEREVSKNFESLKKEALIRQERELLLQDAERLAHMGSWKWSAETNQMVWSDGLYAILDVGPAEVASFDAFLEKVFPADRPVISDFISRMKTTAASGQLHYRIETNEGIRHLLMVVKPLSEDVGIPNVLGSVIDLTEQKLYESQLKQFTLELQRSNHDLEQFAYVASHDLQEPLRKIRTFGDRLVGKYKSKLEGNGIEYIARMQSAAARMQVLIEDLLSFSRVSHPGMLSEKQNLNEIVGEVMEDLEIQVLREHAKIRIENLPSVKGERTQMKRLLQNLISNALKFHKPEVIPDIVVTGSIVKSGDVERNFGVKLTNAEYAQLNIKDNGIGFDEKYKEKIFNIFQRLHGRMEYDGTGIGLAVCRKIVANHGGFITAISEEHVGSDFIVILPID